MFGDMSTQTSDHAPISAPPPLRIATRDSPLAMWQAEYVASRLAAIGVQTTLVPLVSSGDVDMRPMDVAKPGEIRTIGVFTKRIQQALVDDEADVAVHSLKDLPTAIDPRFRLAAVPERADVRDALVSPSKFDLQSLPPSARVGTGSKRRAAQLRSIRGDLDILPIRGNVQTRLAKLEAGQFDAIVLAEAGIERLGMNQLPRVVLPVESMLPAPGQGALGIEVRSDDDNAHQILANLDDFATHGAVVAERTMLSMLDGGCLAPIAALAQWTAMRPEIMAGQRAHDSPLTLTASVFSNDGSVRLRQTIRGVAGDLDQAAQLGRSVAESLIEQGAADLLRRSTEA